MKKQFSFILAVLLSIFMSFSVFAAEDLNGFSFRKKLKNINIAELSESSAEVLIIDYSFDGTDENALSQEDIQKLKDSNKTVLAYFSLGEAEIWRFYWQQKWEVAENIPACYENFWRKFETRLDTRRCDINKRPTWLGPQNPENLKYRVKFWDEKWWEIAAVPYLKRITQAGFDGIYLDIGESFLFWSEQSNQKYPKSTLENDLQRLLKRTEQKGKSLSASEKFFVKTSNYSISKK